MIDRVKEIVEQDEVPVRVLARLTYCRDHESQIALGGVDYVRLQKFACSEKEVKFLLATQDKITEKNYTTFKTL